MAAKIISIDYQSYAHKLYKLYKFFGLKTQT